MKDKNKMYNFIKCMSCGLLLLSSATYAETINFSGADCNSITYRKALIEEYNNVLDGQGITVIDAYNQKTLAKGVNKLVCHGTYSYSDGTTLNVTYKVYPNSLGQLINEFVPDEE
ncbi:MULTISPECIES: hypothetical protein [Enterobacteriaceae]|uniref:hypothetical protein n=1 Tax=Escherichia coli TaxID=562 RepID=UPI001EF73F49|nr:hypothetical protein [Escherichia coli]CAB5611276.1 Uncharacterised protein [Escherichia coli]CAC9203348.1 Uncharacterised protein [Escherichia coli]